MRFDKYLKLTRLIKRRTVAKELLERGLFTVNNRVAKPSSEVKEGDLLVLVLGRHKLTVKVKDVVSYCKKEDASCLYEIVKDEIIDEN
ncbi:MAG: S4 domain-containing protein [Bacilli bacterium]